jgi:hypothetical protein
MKEAELFAAALGLQAGQLHYKRVIFVHNRKNRHKNVAKHFVLVEKFSELSGY